MSTQYLLMPVQRSVCSDDDIRVRALTCVRYSGEMPLSRLTAEDKEHVGDRASVSCSLHAQKLHNPAFFATSLSPSFLLSESQMKSLSIPGDLLRGHSMRGQQHGAPGHCEAGEWGRNPMAIHVVAGPTYPT